LKKITGILSIAVLAVIMFMNTNNINLNKVGVLDLSSMIGLASANAENDDCPGAFSYCNNYAAWAADAYGLTFEQEYNWFSNCMDEQECG